VLARRAGAGQSQLVSRLARAAVVAASAVSAYACTGDASWAETRQARQAVAGCSTSRGTGMGGAPGGGAACWRRLPAVFTPSDHGGYLLGSPVVIKRCGSRRGRGRGRTSHGVIRAATCSSVRCVISWAANQAGGHPDFEVFLSQVATPHLVDTALGTRQEARLRLEVRGRAAPCSTRPLARMAPRPQPSRTSTSGIRNTPGRNLQYVAYFYFEPQATGQFPIREQELFSAR